MKMCWFVALLVWVPLATATGCAQNTVSETELPEEASEVASLDTASPGVESAAAESSAQASSDQFPFQSAPIAANSASSIAPNLIPPTTTPERLPQVSVGRTDPFASLPISPTVSVNIRPAAAPLATTPVAPPVTLPPASVATVPSQTLPTLPTLTPPPPVPIDAFPSVTPVPVVPQRLSEAIEISGVVEVAGKTSVIIHVPNEMSSRYASVGDYLANGKVLIKRVEMGMEPTVILEEDGVETIRYVGSGSSLAGLF
jgi:hypothetical protein